MPQPANAPDERARASAGRYRATQAIRDLARDRGAEFITRPNFPGSGLTVRDLEPLTGARAARDIELGCPARRPRLHPPGPRGRARLGPDRPRPRRGPRTPTPTRPG